jgi:bacteriocin-like protein
MKAKARIILSTTLTLPLLVPTIAESTAGNELVSDTFQASDIPAPVHSTASVLTDKELDAVTGGRPEVVGGPWESPPGLVTTLALGEEGGGCWSICPVNELE